MKATPSEIGAPGDMILNELPHQLARSERTFSNKAFLSCFIYNGHHIPNENRAPGYFLFVRWTYI